MDIIALLAFIIIPTILVGYVIFDIVRSIIYRKRQ
jgi:hypothetical protein